MIGGKRRGCLCSRVWEAACAHRRAGILVHRVEGICTLKGGGVASGGRVPLLKGEASTQSDRQCLCAKGKVGTYAQRGGRLPKRPRERDPYSQVRGCMQQRVVLQGDFAVVYKIYRVRQAHLAKNQIRAKTCFTGFAFLGWSF